jgi:glycosyltransferase involved in cell wall biosynthesis
MVYFRFRDPEHGGAYYRGFNLLNAMKSELLGHFYHDEDPGRRGKDPNPKGRWNDARYEAYMEESKRAIETANVMLSWFDAAPELREFHNKLRNLDARDRIHRPAFIWDCDDNSEHVCPFNPAYANLGTRTWDGTRLKKGDRVSAKIEGGDEVELWVDGGQYDAGTFDIDRNWAMIQSMYENARAADGVSVASLRLKEWFENEVGCENVYFQPNSITLEDFGNFDQWIVRKRRPKEIRIFWQGGASHFADLMSVKPAIEEICKKYPNVKFIVMGQSFPAVWRNIPLDQIEHLSWVQSNIGYRRTLNMTGFDINIAPLKALDFNLYKSACKFYEASVLQMPAATLAADYGAYHDEIKDGETGLLYAPDSAGDFFRKLETLVKSAELRKTLAGNAREWVLKNRLTENTVHGWARWINETRRKMK